MVVLVMRRSGFGCFKRNISAGLSCCFHAFDANIIQGILVDHSSSTSALDWMC
jgi:hypothetical protein